MPHLIRLRSSLCTVSHEGNYFDKSTRGRSFPKLLDGNILTTISVTQLQELEHQLDLINFQAPIYHDPWYQRLDKRNVLHPQTPVHNIVNNIRSVLTTLKTALENRNEIFRKPNSFRLVKIGEDLAQYHIKYRLYFDAEGGGSFQEEFSSNSLCRI